MSLLRDTFTGKNIAKQYHGLTFIDVWNSTRLIFFGIVFASFIGMIFSFATIWMTRTRTKLVRDVLDMILMSVPEPIYVVIVFILAFVAAAYFNIVIPGLFPLANPTWSDTFVPGVAIAIPPALYLQRVLHLRLRDERNADYVATAVSKGSSHVRVLFRHVWPNVLSTFIAQLPVVVALVLSSVPFAEFFFGYHGLYFRFTQLVGWNTLGPAVNRLTRLPVPPHNYETGEAAVAGLLPVAIWVMFDLISRVIRAHPKYQDSRTTPRGSSLKVQWKWVISGGILLSVILILLTFPHIVTNDSPTKKHLLNLQNYSTPPYRPSPLHPFGTDPEGRDLLARVLHGGLNVIGTGAAIASIVTILSLGIALFIASRERVHFGLFLRRFGRVASSLPTFLLLFFAMYQRDVKSHHQVIVYIAWICLFELGRGTVSFLSSMEEWLKFGFVEGIQSMGRSRLAVIVINLRSWVRSFTLAFLFAEFSRVISLMTLLAMFHIYPSEAVGDISLLNGQGVLAVVSTHVSWIAAIGDWSNQVGGVITYPFLLLAPLLALVVTMLGVQLVERGIRGV